MLLRERLERLGGEFFRLRGVLPLLALVEVPVAILRRGSVNGANSGQVLPLIALLIGVIGLVARTLVVAFVPRGTSGRNVRRQRARFLNTTGAYSVVRNPLYAANFLLWMSVSLLLRDVPLLAVNVLLFPALYFVIALREESFLEARFGDSYREYAARVPCALPHPWLWQPPERRFDLRIVLRREPDTWIAFVATFVALQFAWHLLVPGAGALASGWYALLGVSLVLWALLKGAKKFTPLLRTPAEDAS